jgi:predicted AAA+ superfamily ATPase
MVGTASYRARVVDAELAHLIGARRAVLIEGPRACGKTETARQLAASEVLLDVDANARDAAALDPALILTGATPRLIDEWQLEPGIWNHVRRLVDAGKGPFILTGSALAADDATRHTGAGRIARLRMRPMSLFEAGSSTGGISLAALLDGGLSESPDPGLDVHALIDELCRGGWPGLRHLEQGDARRAIRDYMAEVAEGDVRAVEGVARDPERMRRLMQSVARNVATRAPVSTLAADAAGAGGAIDDETARRYLDALRRLMIIEDQPAWRPHLRSRVDLRTTPVKHFVDPSLAIAALRARPESLLNDINLLGLLFESLVIRDLRIYSQRLGGRVLAYRDNKGAEVDAIVESGDGRWGAFEVKLGANRVDEAAESLKAFARKIDQAKSGAPAVLGVIAGSAYGYVRDDGIHVIPIGALGP